ncbi:hypothetical protein FRB97_007889 [Tulasnella sp. 331]|nr:hypothetical protein FRB97_007889 [Tulasnella sp. 331]
MAPWIIILSALLIGSSVAAPTNSSASLGQVVRLDDGMFTGKTDLNLLKFYGIPFAKPPVGDLRFRLPVAADPYIGSHSATTFGRSCPQQPITVPFLPAIVPSVVRSAINKVISGAWGAVFPGGEDCLTLNVIAPKGALIPGNLPVVVWFYGGGFQFGSTNIYDGALIVERSVHMKRPVIFVSVNYRVGLFGFLGGKEVKADGVGNLGLQDQRQALRWVKKYISDFGGDPSKVTLWGQSAGAISAALQMVANGGDTEGLFRGAFMQSGAAVPLNMIEEESVQDTYDSVVSAVGCHTAQDTLQCLRRAPYSALQKFLLASPGIFSYSSLGLTWLPRIDGAFIKESPMVSLMQGRAANIPLVTEILSLPSVCMVKLFSLSTLNVTTDRGFQQWLKGTYLPTANEADLDRLIDQYPDTLSQGSPYDSSILNALTPQFKRIASIQGDLTFQAPRRFMLQNLSGGQNAWSYLHTRGWELPFLGSFHGTDLLDTFAFGELQDYLINFVAYMDPNGPGSFKWPRYTPKDPRMLRLQDNPLARLDYISDTFHFEEHTMFSSLRKRLEDSLDAVEQLATQQMQPRGSFDSSSPSNATSAPPERRRTGQDRLGTLNNDYNNRNGGAVPGTTSPAYLAESAISSIRKSLAVQKGLGSVDGRPALEPSPSKRELRELAPSGTASRTVSTSTRPALTLEDRLKAKFAIGDSSSNASVAATRTPSPASSPATPMAVEASISIIVPALPIDPTTVPLPASPLIVPEVELKAPTPPIELPPLVSPKATASDPLSSSATYQIHAKSVPSSRPSTPQTDLPSRTALPHSPPNAQVETVSWNLGLSLDSPPLRTTSPPPEDERVTPSILDTDMDPEQLRERLQLVQQRFSDVSKSFKRLQAEKVAADKILKEMTPLEGIVDADGLREHLRNVAMKTEMSTEEIKRLNGQIRQHDERVEELRDTHRLETKSQSELIESLRRRVAEAEALITATSVTTSSIEATSSAQKSTITQLQSELSKAKDQVKDEEDKGTKAISLLKTVRSKLVKAEKDKEEAIKERDDMRLERDASRGEVGGLRADIERMKVERERELGGLRGGFERDLAATRERMEKEGATRKGQFELDVITIKAAHAKELNARSARITQLELTIRTLTQEKDAMFDSNQLRQAEVESAQSHLEALTNQNNELQYQLREANDRITVLMSEEMYENHQNDLNNPVASSSRPRLGERESSNPFFPSSPLHDSPAELARLLSEAEGKYEVRLSDMREKVRTMEKERNESEEEWSRNLSERGKEIERLKRLMADKEREFRDKARDFSESESRIAALERRVVEMTLEGEELRKAGEVTMRELEHAREAEVSSKEDKQEVSVRLATLERQAEEFKARDAQLRSNNKTLREELRKVQSSAALLERQRNPGVGYWSGNSSSPRMSPSEPPSRPSVVTNGHGALSPNRVASPAPSESGSTLRRTSTSSSTTSVGGGAGENEEAVNLEYLRNVIMQFLENEKMRPDLVRVLSIILRFTPQETRRLLAKVS